MTSIALINDDASPHDPADGRRELFASLVERVKRGDTPAFEQIMTLTERGVMRTAWRMLGTREDARDASQETFLRAYKYLHRFDSRQDFSAWLYRITINVCLDIRRKQERRNERFASLDDADALEDMHHGHNEEEAAIRRQHEAILLQALETLTTKERAAIVLRDFENLPTEEVARILGSRPATVRSQISAARQKIKTYCDCFLRRTERNRTSREEIKRRR